MTRRIRTNLKIIQGRPDLTPMIDVVFLLLIFFMLYSSFIQISGIKVELPEVSVSEEGSIEKLVITIDHDNSFFFNEKRMADWESLKVNLSQYISRWGADTVILRADRRTDYGEVVRLMSLARSLNLNVYVATVSPEQNKDEEYGGSLDH